MTPKKRINRIKTEMRNCNFQMKIRKSVVEHDKDKSQHTNEFKCTKDKSSDSRRNA